MIKSVEKKREEEINVVSRMIELYCRKKHKTKKDLCESCRELEEYAKLRSMNCPFMEEKTFCSNCKVHCYKPEMREKIKAVMRFSGPRSLFYDPKLIITHMISSWKEKRKESK